jgi:hypothetical protein
MAPAGHFDGGVSRLDDLLWKEEVFADEVVAVTFRVVFVVLS